VGNTADPTANGGDRKNHGHNRKSKGDGVFQKHCAIFIGGQAFNTMLHAQDLLPLVVGDVQSRNGSIRPLIEVARARGLPPVRCALSKATANALEKWITSSGKKRTDYLFPGGDPSSSRPLSGRQFTRLLKGWVVEAGLDPRAYGIESLRRTKALHILKGTGDLQTVRALLGHAQIESTARYLGLKTKADPIAVCRAFDI